MCPASFFLWFRVTSTSKLCRVTGAYHLLEHKHFDSPSRELEHCPSRILIFRKTYPGDINHHTSSFQLLHFCNPPACKGRICYMCSSQDVWLPFCVIYFPALVHAVRNSNFWGYSLALTIGGKYVHCPIQTKWQPHVSGGLQVTHSPIMPSWSTKIITPEKDCRFYQ